MFTNANDFHDKFTRLRAANRIVSYPHGPWSPASFRVFMNHDDGEFKAFVEKYPDTHVETSTADDELAIVVVGVRGVWDCSHDRVVSDEEIKSALSLPSNQCQRFMEQVPYVCIHRFLRNYDDGLNIPLDREQRFNKAMYLDSACDFWLTESRAETDHYEMLQRAYDWVLEKDKLTRYRYAVSMVTELWLFHGDYANINGSNRWTTKIVSLKRAKRALQAYAALCSPIVIPLLVMVRSSLKSVKTFLRRDGDHAIVAEIAQFLPAEQQYDDE